MRNKKKVLINCVAAALITCAFPLPTATAQESLSAAGNQASGSGGSVSYSVGQVVHSINIGTNGTEAQGVQQPFEVMVLKTTEDAGNIDLSISAYLATADFITLSVANLEVTKFSYQLFDMSGKLLELKNLEGNPTRIAMSNYPQGVYVVRVLADENEVKIFKVNKNK